MAQDLQNTVNQNATIANGGGATTFKLMAGKTIHATNVNLTDAAADNTLELYENASITGNVVTANANSGIISVKGKAKIDGAIGAGANAINKIIFNEAAELTVSKNSINTNAGIEFKENGTLNLTEAAAFTTDKAIIVAQNKDGLGTIRVNNATGGQLVKFDQIGDVAAADKSLGLLEVTGGANIELNKNASIKKLNIGSQNVEIKLTGLNGEYLISELAHNKGSGALVLDQDVTLKTGTNFGAALDFIQLKDKTLTIQDGVDLTATNGIRSSQDGKGSLLFTGDSKVSGVVGSNNKLENVTINSGNKNKIVNFLDKFNIAGDLKIAQGDTAILRGEVVAGDIQGAGANQGTVKFFNKEVLSGATAVTPKIGNGNALDTVELGGKDITFNSDGTFKTNTLSFTGKNGLTELTATFTKLAADSLQNTTITTDSEIRGHHIVLNDDNHALDAAIGSKTNHFGNLHYLMVKLLI